VPIGPWSQAARPPGALQQSVSFSELPAAALVPAAARGEGAPGGHRHHVPFMADLHEVSEGRETPLRL
jgi:hypothetical protein